MAEQSVLIELNNEAGLDQLIWSLQGRIIN